MSRAVRELSMIPFGVLIGQPLKAAVEAQALAAKTTVDFIEKVGFVPEDPNEPMLFADENADAIAGEVRNVSFSYKKTDENGVEKSFNLTVPILSIVPIPFLRIDEMTIDFSASITDMVEQNTSSSFNASSSYTRKYRSWWSPVQSEFRASVDYKRTSSTKATYTSKYTMDIHVRAVQDAIPGGLDRILHILESAITEKQDDSATQGLTSATVGTKSLRKAAAPAAG